MDAAVSRIKTQNKWIGIMVASCIAFIFIGIAVVSKKVENGPEKEAAQAFVSNSKEIQSKYGEIIEGIECVGYEISKGLTNSTSSGSFDFRIKGTKKEGVEQVFWERKSEVIKITSMSEVKVSNIKDIIRDIKSLFRR